MKKFFSFIMLVVFCTSAFSQDSAPRVAVLPFNHINVSESEALVITGLFETALVKTEAFNVIEQTQVGQILDAQKFSLTGCTDESCAVEVGKLLSAEQILIGTLSALDGKFILIAKVIDVTTGRNVKADTVRTDSLSDMSEDVELLAFKLAGLTMTGDGGVRIVKSFGELYVETDPEGADIFVNGALKGQSPNLIQRTPLGSVTVECRLDELYGSEEIEIQEGMNKVSLKLSVVYGNIFVSGGKKDQKVHLDGKVWGDLGGGLIEDVPLGLHEILLINDNEYWKGAVEVAEAETARVTARLIPYGSLEYTIPDDAFAEIVGPEYRSVVRGRGTLLPLNGGEYKIIVTGEAYKNYATNVRIDSGKNTAFEPNLEPSEKRLAVLEGERELENLLALRDSLRFELVDLQSKPPPGAFFRWFSYILGGGFTALSVLSALQAEGVYDSYLSATTGAADRRKQVEQYDTISVASGAAAITSVGIGIWLAIKKTGSEKITALEEEITALDEKIENLEEASP